MSSSSRRRIRRPNPVVENDQYAAFARRVIRGYAKRVAKGDIDALPELASMAAEIDRALRNVAAALYTRQGYSWAQIGGQLGITRQAARQRFEPALRTGRESSASRPWPNGDPEADATGRSAGHGSA